METGTNKTIGGWLILVGFGILTRPFYLLFSVYPMYSQMFTPERWEMLRTAGRMAYGPFFIPFIYTELILNILFVLAALYQIYLFVTKDYRFPKFFIYLLIASLLFILLDAWISGLIIEEVTFDADTMKEIIRIIIPSIIWIPYMIYSERVKETFTKTEALN